MQEAQTVYPVTLEVDYPERQSRWKTLLRLFLAIPVLIFASILSNATSPIAIASWIAIILRGHIPRWMFDIQVRLIDWQVRAYGYFALLTDTYPAFEADYPIRFSAEYPERVARWKVIIWKIVTAVPHLIVLFFLGIAAIFTVIIGWFAVLFSGHFPKGMHAFVVGVGRWYLRVEAYVLSLRDEYPPFSLSPDAGAAGKDTYVIGAVIGWLLAAAAVAGIVVAAIVMPGAERVSVDYAALKAGNGAVTVTVGKTDVTLLGATDPGNSQVTLLSPDEGTRFVSFQLEITNNRSFSLHVRNGDFRLRDGGRHEPVLLIVGGKIAPVNISGHGTVSVYVLFQVDEGKQPTELRFRAPPTEAREIIWEFQ
jgi:hypothetical protein